MVSLHRSAPSTRLLLLARDLLGGHDGLEQRQLRTTASIQPRARLNAVGIERPRGPELHVAKLVQQACDGKRASTGDLRGPGRRQRADVLAS